MATRRNFRQLSCIKWLTYVMRVTTFVPLVETFQTEVRMAGPAEGVPALELRDVTKAFGPVRALRSGTISVQSGSIHALVGENGAGKSTLVKIVAGVYRRDGGEVLLDGRGVDF